VTVVRHFVIELQHKALGVGHTAAIAVTIEGLIAERDARDEGAVRVDDALDRRTAPQRRGWDSNPR
jgi:hypothetical protein